MQYLLLTHKKIITLLCTHANKLLIGLVNSRDLFFMTKTAIFRSRDRRLQTMVLRNIYLATWSVARYLCGS